MKKRMNFEITHSSPQAFERPILFPMGIAEYHYKFRLGHIYLKIVVYNHYQVLRALALLVYPYRHAVRASSIDLTDKLLRTHDGVRD